MSYQSLELDFGSFGLDTRIPAVAPKPLGFNKAENGYFTVRSSFKSRPGHTWFGPDFANADTVDGLFDFWLGAASEYILSIQSGIVWLYNNGAWTQLSVSTPSAPTLAFSSSAGTLPAATYTYAVTALNGQGETLASPPTSITTTATGEIAIYWTAVPGATSYNVYGRTNGALGLISNTTYLSLMDNGSITPTTHTPTTDTASLTPGIPWNFAILANKVCFGNGVNHNLIYDGTTLSDLTVTAGSYNLPPCQYFLTHMSRMYASGNPADPSSLFWSSVDNPSNWTAPNDAGNVLVEVGKDIVMGLGSFQGDVWIFKGPNYGSIHVLQGTSYNNFSLAVAFRGMFGFHRTIVNSGNDLFFQGPDGIYSLGRMMQSGGNIQQSRISENVQALFANLTPSTLGMGCAVFYEPENIVVFYVSLGGVSLDSAFALSPPDPIDANIYGFGQSQYKYRWAHWTLEPCDIAVYRIDSVGNKGVLTGFIDSATGFRRVASWNFSAGTDADGVAFSTLVATPYLSFNMLLKTKLLRHFTGLYFSTQEVLLSFKFQNGSVWTATLAAVLSVDWPTAPITTDWPSSPINSVWPSPQPQLNNVPIGGEDDAFAVQISSLSGAVLEFFAFQVDYMLGARKEI